MFSAQEIFILRKENALLKTANTKLKSSFVSQKQKADLLEDENKTLRKKVEERKRSWKRLENNGISTRE